MEDEAQQFIIEARGDKIHVDDYFTLKIFGDLVMAKMEIFKCYGDTIKIDAHVFNKELTNFEESEAEDIWSRYRLHRTTSLPSEC